MLKGRETAEETDIERDKKTAGETYVKKKTESRGGINKKGDGQQGI